jgi:NAD+ diphosphatase
MIDRSDQLRGNPSFIDAARHDAASRFVVYAGSDVLLRPYPPIAPAGVPARSLKETGADAEEAVFLGLEDGAPWFAIDIVGTGATALSSLEPLGRFVALGSIQDPVEGEAWSLLAQARALLAWNARSLYCSVCGAPTETRDAGHVRACTNADCKVLQFPRTDPAVIVRVTHEDRCLLARQPAYRPGLRSILAGFVEPGESLEDAVRREVGEEVGLRLTCLSYVASQPWPFPTSLMVGFAAEAAGREIHVDGREIEMASWMTRADVRSEMQRGALILPSMKSIARRLIDDWLNEA